MRGDFGILDGDLTVAEERVDSEMLIQNVEGEVVPTPKGATYETRVGLTLSQCLHGLLEPLVRTTVQRNAWPASSQD